MVGAVSIMNRYRYLFRTTNDDKTNRITYIFNIKSQTSNEDSKEYLGESEEINLYAHGCEYVGKSTTINLCSKSLGSITTAALLYYRCS